MRLSKLQKYILLTCFESRNNARLKTDLYAFYPKIELKKNKIGVQVSVQKSIDNLVAKDLMVAYGHKTARKWNVDKIKLSARGRKKARELIKKRQPKLPIK